MTPDPNRDIAITLRPPAAVMRLDRLGALHQSRLSFMRILTRRMTREAWRFTRPVFDIDANGVGVAVYSAHSPDRVYSLVAFAHDLPDEKRSDRVIAEAWDSTFTLFDGVPSSADLDRLRANIPYQEAGRVTESELSVARANRSVRLWAHVVSELAQGRQPDPAEIAKVGYLMRTTAVYGSGKLGAADREQIANRPEFSAPFQVEMLSVFLIRTFVRDLAQHMANAQGGAQAAQLDPQIARSLGIGNSTGLGMAPFLVNHPILFNNWIVARETALARVRAVPRATQAEITLFRDLVHRACQSADLWHSTHPLQVAKLAQLRPDLAKLARYCDSADLTDALPWERLMAWSETELGVDAQEHLVSLMLEPYGPLVDDLTDRMSDDDAHSFRIDGSMRIDAVRGILRDAYGWALPLDWSTPQNCARAWYVSAEKLEPRLGERFDEPIAPYEQPLAPGRDAAALYMALAHWPDETPVASFVLQHPEHRHMLRRAQIVSKAPYAEIRDNTIGADLMPIDMLRCKLAFFGATHFDPRSDRWVRICLFGNAPYPEDLATSAEDWPYPPSPAEAE